MAELLLAVVVVAMFGERTGIDTATAPLATAGLWLATYALSCAVWPYRACPSPWCTKRRPTKSDKRGNYRRRAACKLCGGKDWRRVGARLIGSGNR